MNFPRLLFQSMALAIFLIAASSPSRAQSPPPLVPVYANNPDVKWINYGGAIAAYPYRSPDSQLARVQGACEVQNCPIVNMPTPPATQGWAWTGRYVFREYDGYGAVLVNPPYISINMASNPAIQFRLGGTADNIVHAVDMWIEIARPGNFANFFDGPTVPYTGPVTVGGDTPSSTKIQIPYATQKRFGTTYFLGEAKYSSAVTFPFRTEVVQPIYFYAYPGTPSVRWWYASNLPVNGGYKLIKFQNSSSAKCANVNPATPDKPIQGHAVTLNPCQPGTVVTDAFRLFMPGSPEVLQTFLQNAANNNLNIGDSVPVMAQVGSYGRCLDLPYESTAFGEGLVIGQCTAHDSQRWNLIVAVYYNGPKFQLRNVNSNYCMDVEGHSNLTNARITQGLCDYSSMSQLWSLKMYNDLQQH